MIRSFSVAWFFDMKVVSVILYTDNPIPGSPFQVLFVRLFIFKVNSISNLKVSCRVIYCLLCVFGICCHPMFSWLWLVQEGAFPNSVIQNLGHQEIVAWVLAVDVGEDWDLSHKWGRRVFYLLLGVELCDNWWVPGWCTGFQLSWSFSQSFLSVVFRYLWNTFSFPQLSGWYGAEKI